MDSSSINSSVGSSSDTSPEIFPATPPSAPMRRHTGSSYGSRSSGAVLLNQRSPVSSKPKVVVVEESDEEVEEVNDSNANNTHFICDSDEDDQDDYKDDTNVIDTDEDYDYSPSVDSARRDDDSLSSHSRKGKGMVSSTPSGDTQTPLSSRRNPSSRSPSPEPHSPIARPNCDKNKNFDITETTPDVPPLKHKTGNRFDSWKEWRNGEQQQSKGMQEWRQGAGEEACSSDEEVITVTRKHQRAHVIESDSEDDSERGEGEVSAYTSPQQQAGDGSNLDDDEDLPNLRAAPKVKSRHSDSTDSPDDPQKYLSPLERYGHKYKIKKKSPAAPAAGRTQLPDFDRLSLESSHDKSAAPGGNQSTSSILEISGMSSANLSGQSTSSSSSFSDMTVSEMMQKLKQKKNVLRTVKLSALPDKGAKLRAQVQDLEEALANLSVSTTQNVSGDQSPGGGAFSDVSSNNNSVSSNEQSPLTSSSHDMRTKLTYKSEITKNSQEQDTGEWNYNQYRLNDSQLPQVTVAPPKTSDDDEKAKRLQLQELKMLYCASNLRNLEDGGKRLKQRIAALEKELMMIDLKENIDSEVQIIHDDGPVQEYRMSKGAVAPIPLVLTNGTSSKQTQRKQEQEQHFSQQVLEAIYAGDTGNIMGHQYGGKISSARERQMVRVTSDALQDLHDAIKSAPDVERVSEEQPRHIKVTLMPHQGRALAWMLWRESQLPRAGILADDMGLGKTLTMISLLLRHRELVESGTIPDDFTALKKDENDPDKDEEEEEEEESNWFSKYTSGSSLRRNLVPSRGTLVVCPASLIGQWELEVKRMVSRSKINPLIYHGNNRQLSLKMLASYDLVVTTYQIVMREAFPKSKENVILENKDAVPKIKAKNQGSLFSIGWTRIVLDEAHVIRNHKSKTSQSVCLLRGGRRWALTGTPVQNREMDMYSLIRFLRAAPFDDYTCWKHQIGNNSARGRRCLELLVKVLLLRRTKDQVDQSTGKKMVELPEKTVVQHNLSLSQMEREVYDRIFAFSKSRLVQYMKTQEEKEQEKMQKWPGSSDPAFTAPRPDDTRYTPTMASGWAAGEEVTAHHLLVLLLRLRQICCHPALIQSIIDSESKEAEGLEGQGELERDLVQHMADLSLAGTEEQARQADTAVRDTVLTAENPIFKRKKKSCKIRKLIEELGNIQEAGKKEKAVVVSQWTNLLCLVETHLSKAGIRCTAITGQVAVKDRPDIIDDFNNNPRGAQVMLLSLQAGGVGLNLVGANHLFLLDMHWNPQLESQACDRIYRVGQTRPVTVHRFVIENTVEEKILQLQNKKLALAEEVLSGAKHSVNTKLTIDDLKSLFNVEPPRPKSISKAENQ